MKTLQLETERLLLRPFRLGDEAEVLAFSSNPTINKYTGDPIVTTMEGVTKLITNVWLHDYKEYGYGRFAVIHKEDAKIIGFCGVKFLKEANETDLGYRFLPEYWGQGIATESSIAIVEYAFETLQLVSLVASVYPENESSSKLLKKLKFQFEKTSPYPNETDPLLWYRLTKQRYERQEKSNLLATYGLHAYLYYGSCGWDYASHTFRAFYFKLQAYFGDASSYERYRMASRFRFV